MEVLQVPSELAQMVALYRKRKPRRVLEIGSWEGGTLRVWLEEGAPEVVVAVDLEHRKPDNYPRWCKSETELVVITGNSQDVDVKDRVRSFAPFDWVFVDGDHGNTGVRNDVALARECAAEGAILVMHDIERGALNEGDPSPRVVFEELRREGLEVDEYVERPYGGNWAHGIGVVQL